MNQLFLLSLLAAVVELSYGLARVNSSDANDENTRIMDGQTAFAGQFPFMAAVHKEDQFLCGSFLISTYWLITSAICIWEVQNKPELVKISVGGLQHSGQEPGKYTVLVSEIVPHHSFGRSSRDEYLYYNNIALIRLKQAVMVGDLVFPISLPYGTETVPTGQSVMSAGWGGSEDDNPSIRLQYGHRMIVMELKKCADTIGMPLTPDDICTDMSSEIACKYDHGSPLFRHDPITGYVAIGVVNYAPCGHHPLPNVYASVIRHRYWINTYTNL